MPPELARIINAQQTRALKPVRPVRRPHSVPIQDYTGRRRTPIPNGYGTGTISASGAATVTVGPQGLGTVWYPQNAAIMTTTGANDASTCQLYVGPLSALQLINGTSYAGGGDSIGLGVPPLTPGYFIVAVWAGGHTGDTASLAVYGAQDTLTTLPPDPYAGRLRGAGRYGTGPGPAFSLQDLLRQATGSRRGR